jgi:hypothetical protein
MITALLSKAARCGLLLAALGSRAAAQSGDTVEVHVYHGTPSRIVRMIDERGAVSMRDGRRARFYAAAGDAVCVSVANANPLLFSYAVNSVVDTTALGLSQSAKDFVQAIALASGGNGVGLDAAGFRFPNEVRVFLDATAHVAAEGEQIARLFERADEPGVLDEEHATVTDHGVALVLAGYRALPDTAGRIRNASIVAHIERLAAAALQAIDREQEAQRTAMNADQVAADALTRQIQAAGGGRGRGSDR